MSKNSINLSEEHFCTHNLNGDSISIGELSGPQKQIVLTVHEALELKAFLERELYLYGDME